MIQLCTAISLREGVLHGDIGVCQQPYCHP